MRVNSGSMEVIAKSLSKDEEEESEDNGDE